jgi:hypothetical protein
VRADRFGGAGFLELERGYQPWVIPKSEARGGAGHAVKKVKRWLRKMDEQMDYEFYDWNLRSYRFKSPFDRRPLVGPRERCRYISRFARLLPLDETRLMGFWGLISDGSPCDRRCFAVFPPVQEKRREAHPPFGRAHRPGLPASVVGDRNLICSFL